MPNAISMKEDTAATHPVDPLTKKVVTLTILEPADHFDRKCKTLHQHQHQPLQQQRSPSAACGLTNLRRNENIMTSLTSSVGSFPGAYSVDGPQSLHDHVDTASEEEDGNSINSSSSSSTSTCNQDPDVEKQSAVVVTAAEVTDDQVERMEREIRNQILKESVVADQVVPLPEQQAHDKQDLREGHRYERQDSSSFVREKRRLILIVLIVLGALVAVALAFGLTQRAQAKDKDKNKDEDNLPPVASTSSDSTTSTTSTLSVSPPVLQSIRQRGFIRCGLLFYMPGFAMPPQDTNKQGDWQGINVEHCRALSVAVFGNPHQFEMVELNSTRAQSLAFVANQTVDVLTDFLMATMDRDRLLGGFTFSTPYLYSQSKFVGVPDYVDCADQLDSFNGVCRQVKVCVSAGSVQEGILTNQLPGSALVPFQSRADWIQKWNLGDCNVILANTAFTTKDVMRSFGYQGPYATGTKVFASGPLVLATREQDQEWSTLVNLMVHTSFWAEANHIVKGTPPEEILLHYMPSITDANDNDMTDSGLTRVMADMISQVGNYGESYQHTLQSVIPREGLNLLDTPAKNGTSGLVYAFPFGMLEQTGPDPSPDGCIGRIMDRGFLRCGVRPKRGFALQDHGVVWEGMDVDMCRAVTAAIFQGQLDKIHFVNLTAEETFAGLDNTPQVDLIAGALVTIHAGYKGFSFSRPYYFEDAHQQNQTTQRAYALMTGPNHDSEWSDFVFWIVNSLFYAEEQGIHQDTSILMPVVSLFGEGLKQMFRDAVSAVGSYPEVYQRNLESLIPRGESRNLLNSGLSGPQHYAIPLV